MAWCGNLLCGWTSASFLDPRTGRHQLPSGTTAGSGSRVRYATMGRAQVPLSGRKQSSTGAPDPGRVQRARSAVGAAAAAHGECISPAAIRRGSRSRGAFRCRLVCGQRHPDGGSSSGPESANDRGRAPSVRVSAAAPAHRVAHLCRVAPGPNHARAEPRALPGRPNDPTACRDRAAAGRRERCRPRPGMPIHRAATRDTG